MSFVEIKTVLSYSLTLLRIFLFKSLVLKLFISLELILGSIITKKSVLC